MLQRVISHCCSAAGVRKCANFTANSVSLPRSLIITNNCKSSSYNIYSKKTTISHRHYCTEVQSIKKLQSGAFSSPRPTHKCGEVVVDDVGSEVALTGWLSSIRTMGSSLAFAVIRDSTGTVQVVIEFPKTSSSSSETSHPLLVELSQTPLESVVYFKGILKERPIKNSNEKLATGHFELNATEFEVLNRAEKLPLPFHRTEVEVSNEDMKLRYRYLELRQPYLQRNIRLRSEALQVVRKYLINRGFTEIETPTLFRKTSEGAREYVVPTRTPNKFYTLTQSPQQYKQLLMASGFDKYFQVARCYRDEDLRADRQPEFTQIDMEMAFIQQSDIMEVIEGVIGSIWKSCLDIDLPTEFPRKSYRWCLDNYGSDKPDTRFELLLKDCSSIIPLPSKDSSGVSSMDQHQYSSVFEKLKDPVVRGLNLKGIVGSSKKLSSKDLDMIKSFAKDQFLLAFFVEESSSLKPLTQNKISEEEQLKLKELLQLEPGDIAAICIGERDPALNALGKMRLWARDLLISTGQLVIPADRFDIFWVVDFPLFTWEEGQMLSTHHPFTAPVSEDAHLLSTHPEQVRGQHYDVVLNGYEVGGGSIRIHKTQDQIRVLKDILGMPAHKLAEFQHLIDALSHGCPPHGGIALGFDRLMAVAVGAKSLRDVIAFPKSSSGAEVMTGAPAPIGNEELKGLLDLVNASIKEASKSL